MLKPYIIGATHTALFLYQVTQAVVMWSFLPKLEAYPAVNAAIGCFSGFASETATKLNPSSSNTFGTTSCRGVSETKTKTETQTQAKRRTQTKAQNQTEKFAQTQS